jgi:hypothetical protein
MQTCVQATLITQRGAARIAVGHVSAQARRGEGREA